MSDSPVNPPKNPAAPPHDELTFNTTPNILTMIRIAFVPVVVGLLFVRTPATDIFAAAAFAIASITDYFDGYIARSRQIVTVYGKLLDPLADKFLIVSSLIALQDLGRIHSVVVMLLVSRELAITGLRALASAEGVIISASDSAKWKTATQMVAIPFLMCGSNLFHLPLFPVGNALLYLSLAISLWSAKSYIVGFFHGMQEKRRMRIEKRKAIKESRAAARREARLAGGGKLGRRVRTPKAGLPPKPEPENT